MLIGLRNPSGEWRLKNIPARSDAKRSTLRGAVQSGLINLRVEWAQQAFGRAASEVLAVAWNSIGEASSKRSGFSLRIETVASGRRQTSSSDQVSRWSTSSDSRGPFGGRLPPIPLRTCLQVTGGFESPLAGVRRKLTKVRLRTAVRLGTRLRGLGWWWESPSGIVS
jgi:hypothetical protein